MSIAIAIIPTNEDLLRAANNGDMPKTPIVFEERDLPAYLIMESGMKNRVVSARVLKTLGRVKSFQRKIWTIQ